MAYAVAKKSSKIKILASFLIKVHFIDLKINIFDKAVSCYGKEYKHKNVFYYQTNRKI